jgi:hypothetical protein
LPGLLMVRTSLPVTLTTSSVSGRSCNLTNVFV